MSLYLDDDKSYREFLGESLPFNEGEYRTRLQNIKNELSNQRIDALLMFHQESMYYTFGYDQLGYWVYQVAIVSPEIEGVCVLARTADELIIRGLPGVQEVRTWTDDSYDAPEVMTLNWLKELGLTGTDKRIGVELSSHALLPRYVSGLMQEIEKESTFVDASDIVTNLRNIQSASELDYTFEASKYIDAGYRGAFERMAPGETEANVLAGCFNAMFEAGGYVPAIVPPLSSGLRALSNTHGAATQKKLKENELVVIEPAGVSQRYHVVGVQCKWLGSIPGKVQSTYDSMLEALQAGENALVAGNGTKDVARAVNQTLDKYGILEAGSHVGYGTGIGYPPTWLNNMRLKETDESILTPNMVFFMFTHYILEHDNKPVPLFVGFPVITTEGAAKRLTRIDLSLELP